MTLPYSNLKQFSECRLEDIFREPPQDILAGSKYCRDRILQLEKRLCEIVVGQRETIRIMVASAVAQQPCLMIGPPGVAKTLLAAKFFELLGLRRPEAEAGRTNNGYFEYLLHSFSIPEEIFGPYDISAMRGAPADPKSGSPEIPSRMVRINTNMLTGAGIRACFLDEVFKAGSAILNTMLTLINERKYFNDSTFHKSDLRVIIGASNETPTAKGDEWAHSKVAGEMRAFYDRWTMRTLVLAPNSPLREHTSDSLYLQVHRSARNQHGSRFHTVDGGYEKESLSCINDLIVLGRCLIAPDGGRETAYRDVGIKVASPSKEFTDLLLKLGRGLDEEDKQAFCTMNPRKLLYGEMVARAHALLKSGPETEMSNEHLAVFRYIWDDESKLNELANAVNGLINHRDPLLRGE